MTTQQADAILQIEDPADADEARRALTPRIAIGGYRPDDRPEDMTDED